MTAARLLIASEWKTGFEMEIVQKQTKTHSLNGDDEQKMTFQAHIQKNGGQKDYERLCYFLFPS